MTTITWLDCRRRARGGISHKRDRVGVGYTSATSSVHLSMREPGITGTENSVPVTGGSWSLRLPDGTSRSGRVKSGVVRWPPTINDNIARCPDDTHVTSVFPPHI